MVKEFVIEGDPADLSESPEGKIDYFGALNPSQLEAATHRDGPLLVIAGAGSGKTRALVYRVAFLVKLGIPPESILLLTFTRKAAQEMLARAATLIDSRCERVAGGTFHAFANQSLRQYADLIGFPRGFTIMDRGDAEDAINLIRAEMGLHRKERRFPRKNTLANILGKSINRNLPVPQIIHREYPHFASFTSEIVTLFEAYARYKRENGLMDYDDLLFHFRDLLRDHPEVCQEFGERYRYVMIDEFQDTNLVQGEIAGLLARTHQNIVVVGDDAQSIYRFRGATVQNILDFPKRFPGTKIVKLEENYRSVQPILDVANAVIGKASRQYRKKLFTHRTGGEKPLLLRTRDEHEQSKFVTQQILRIREEGVPLNEIAVLFRSSFHAYDLEVTLTRYGVPFVKYGGFKFFEAAHVKDVLAYLRVVLNPRDSVSANRLFRLLDGIGAQSSLDIVRWMAQAEDPLDLRRYDAKPRQASTLSRLGELLLMVRDARSSPTEKVERIIEHYRPVLEKRYDDYPKRARDLEQLLVITERFSDLHDLLAEMALDPPSKSIGETLAAVEEDEGHVVLSTIHSAKGLEWHTVFLIWALDGRFPPIMATESQADLEEERRLFYVAVTRARENLYITAPTQVYDRVSGSFFSRPSRFLADIPKKYLETGKIVPRR